MSRASLEQVLQLWLGLGYNRRARFLWQTAKDVHMRFGDDFPHEYADLVSLPGIGPNTAGAIQTYAYDLPVIFIETNIRSICIHHCFEDGDKIPDAALRPILETALAIATTDGKVNHTPRTWYWALMDYGTYLKQTTGNAAQRSTSYARQSKFEGSRRQIRGKVLRTLTESSATVRQLEELVHDDRLTDVLTALSKEGLIYQARDRYHLGTA